MRTSIIAAPRRTSRPIALSLVLAAALAAPASAQERPLPTMTMQGVGHVFATPDTALVNAGVTSDGKTAREALDSNTASMTRLLETLKAAGVEPRDIQTSNFLVSPQYVYTDSKDANGYQLPPRLIGYQVSNTVTVKVRERKNLGAILDQIVTAGANTINGISFSVDDPSKLLDEARKDAFGDAKAKAELYAAAAGIELGAILSISEQPDFQSPQPYMLKDMRAMAEAAPVPIEAGEVSYAINVTVQWELE